MPEHTPAPTAARSIYGFVLYLMFNTILFMYIGWAFLPDSFLNNINIYYYPQKYWAACIPIIFLNGLTLFAFFFYPALNLMMTPHIDDIRTILDGHSESKNHQPIIADNDGICACKPGGKCYKERFLSNRRKSRKLSAIPPAEDIDISVVSRLLYSK